MGKTKEAKSTIPLGLGPEEFRISILEQTLEGSLAQQEGEQDIISRSDL